MDETTKLNLCRICLESGAKLPLFENNQDENCNIQSKLSICFKEKIEDIDGYPRFICQPCKDILDETYNFIIKYKDTCRILENGLHILKEESIEYNFSDNEQSEEEIDIKDIKNEFKSSNETDLGDQNEETFEPVQLNINLKLEKKKPTKKLKYKRIRGTNTKQLTSKVASSILEGEFAWNGDKWCLNTEKTNNKIKEKIKSLIYTTQKGKQIRIRIPRKKIPNPPKLCDLCGKVFNTADRLSYHKRSVHFPKPVKCSLCPKMLSSDYYLARHMKRSHNGEKKFMCSICGRGFVFKGELSSHDRNVHKKHLKLQKDYKCQFCDKIYKCAKSVLVHERSAHTGQRPAVCTVCGSSFFHEDYLKEHMRLHTGETPFKCPICGRGYAQRGNMKSHLRIHKISELDASTLSKLRPNYLRLLKA